MPLAPGLPGILLLVAAIAFSGRAAIAAFSPQPPAGAMVLLATVAVAVGLSAIGLGLRDHGAVAGAVAILLGILLSAALALRPHRPVFESLIGTGCLMAYVHSLP